MATESFTSEDGMLIHRAEFLVCDPCVKLEGQECHTPECVFCFQPVSVARAVLNKTLNCPIIDGERIILLGGDSTQDTKSSEASHKPDRGMSVRNQTESESASVHQPDVQAADVDTAAHEWWLDQPHAIGRDEFVAAFKAGYAAALAASPVQPEKSADEIAHEDSYWDDPLRGTNKC